MIGPRHLDSLLRDWANIVALEVEHGGYSGETNIHKLMECGVVVGSTVQPVNWYWPVHMVCITNNAISQLDTRYRNYFVSRYVMGINSKPDIAEKCGVTRQSIYNWWNGGEPYKELLILINS